MPAVDEWTFQLSVGHIVSSHWGVRPTWGLVRSIWWGLFFDSKTVWDGWAVWDAWRQFNVISSDCVKDVQRHVKNMALLFYKFMRLWVFTSGPQPFHSEPPPHPSPRPRKCSTPILPPRDYAIYLLSVTTMIPTHISLKSGFKMCLNYIFPIHKPYFNLNTDFFVSSIFLLL